MAPTAADTAADLLAKLDHETDRLDLIDRYLVGEHDGPYMPSTASAEYRLLAERATTNLLPLVVNGLAQSLYVDGYRQSETGQTAPAWRWWQANGLDARQTSVHRAALSYGYAYATVLPGTLGTQTVPVIRGVSPRRMIAVYDDASVDEWPLYAVRVAPFTREGKRGRRIWLYDSQNVYDFTTESTSGTVTARSLTRGKVARHDAGVCPIVEFRAVPDLEGRARGEVEPLVTVQDRVNQNTFDALVAASFGSFKIRTVSGMTPALDAEGNPKPIPVDARRFLMARDPDVKFGQLDETDIRPLLDAVDAGMRHLAVISQTPPADLLGQLANLSAEALAAARDGQNRKKMECQAVFGETWERLLRLASRIAGDTEGAEDTAAQVVWRDVEARSLAQVADALGKLAQMLGVPPEGLWPRIPGVTATDIEAWQRLRAEARANEPLALLADHVNRAGREVGTDGPNPAGDNADQDTPA